MIITPEQALVVILIMARLLGMVVMAPVFSNQQIIAPVKIALIFWMAGMISFFVPLPAALPSSMSLLVLALILEFMIGIIYGFVAQLLIVGVELAGSLIDTQAGISAAALFDPGRGQQATLVSKLYREIVVLMFLILQGHHALLISIRASFDLIPIGAGTFPMQAIAHVFQMGGVLFKIGIQIAAPLLIVIFLLDFAFGMLSRVAPQVNVFQLSFQLKPLVMVSVLMLVVPGLVYSVERIIEKILEEFVLLSRLLVS